MQRRTKLKILFVVTFVAGVGLCIGAIWLPPLAGPGVALIGGSLAMYQSSLSSVPRGTSENPSPETSFETARSSSTEVVVDGEAAAQTPQINNTYIQNNLLFMYNTPFTRQVPPDGARPDRLTLV